MMRMAYGFIFTILTAFCISSHAVGASFSIVALPDTQHYTQSYPTIFTGQTNWIKTNKAGLGIAFVSHLGDITDDGWVTSRWENARTSMQVLNGVVPYGLCPGNHDLMTSKDPYTYDSTKFVTYFGPSYFAGYPWYGGASPSGFSSWQMTTAGGFTLLFLHLDVDAPDAEIQWAKSVLAAHSDIPTVLTTHTYMNNTGRYRSPSVPGRNSAETIWDELIRQHDQIVCVLCGHYYPDGYRKQISINNSGRKIYEMLSDYQGESNGGNGWLRIITFDTTAGTMAVKTYSPYLGAYKTDADNEFTYSFDLAARFAPQTTLRLLKPQVTSSFASTVDGWTRIGDDNSTMVWKSDANGKGYLYYSEGASGSGDYFVAPSKFQGNLSSYDAITFDYRVFTEGGEPNPTYIRLYSGSQYYQWANTELVTNNDQWERLTASLKDPDLWVPGGGATEAFGTFITHITNVRVYADIVSGAEYNGLDNFSLARYETQSRAVVWSTFDDSMDGWTVDADGSPGHDSHGSAMATDTGGGVTWHFCAPAKFLGDKLICNRGALIFQMKQSKVDNQFDSADVVLAGAGLSVSRDIPIASNPDSVWTSYTFSLISTSGWINDATGVAPTASEFQTLLSALTSIRIRGEYRSGADKGWIDNVVMSAPAPVTVPSISEAKKRADGVVLSITNPLSVTVASSTFSDGSFYLEEQNRNTGIKVVPESGVRSVLVGNGVTAWGMISTDSNGERYIRLASLTPVPGIPPVSPLGFTNRTVLGGLNPTGLLVTMWGRLTHVEPVTPPHRPGYAYIDDGSALSLDSQEGVKVLLDGLNTPITTNLSSYGILVTGILTLAQGENGAIPVIRPRSDADIVAF